MFASVEGIVHFLSQEAARHLLEVLPDFEPAWCTGWEEKADDHLPAALGLGPFPHLSFDAAAPVGPGATTPGHWKLAAIDAYAGDRPLAWVDDAFNDACWAWARDRGAPTLLVETLPSVGVTAEHAARLRDWARSL